MLFLLNMCYYCVNVYLLLLNELVTYINKGLYFHDFHHTKIQCSCPAFHLGEQATVLNIYIDQHSFQHPMLVTSILPASHAGHQHPTSIPCWSPASHTGHQHPTSIPCWSPASNQHSMLVTSIPPASHTGHQHPTSIPCWSPAYQHQNTTYAGLAGDQLCWSMLVFPAGIAI